MRVVVMALLLLCAAESKAQSFSRYIIQFKNKTGTPFTTGNPAAFLSQRAIERRTRYSIAVDSTDLPVTPRYLDSIRSAGSVTILNVSRWLNQVSIQTTDPAALNTISRFTFVQTVAPIAKRIAVTGGRSGQQSTLESYPALAEQKAFNPAADFYNYGSSYEQIHIHNGEFLHNIGLRGQGMVIGMLDGGFYRYTNLKAFDSVNTAGQVLGVYDFVAKDNSVTEDDTHGMQCFSVIAANIPGQFVGAAPKAAFYLFRSEEASSEYPIEEHNWVCAAERLDSCGGDVISSSLGYNTFDDPSFNHTYADMNGNKTIAAIGADLAAKKGILVVNAAGNEGDDPWGKITTPADGDSVLAIGAVTKTGVPAGFTSRGPSSDGQVKPNVSSVGVATTVQTSANTIGANNGTSFACPNMAGLATCLWQGFPEFNNMKIFGALQQAGDRYTNPNDTTGYGIPDMRKAVMLLLKDFATAAVVSSSCRNTVSWTSKDAAGMRYEIERKAPGETAYTKIGEKAVAGTSFSTHQYQFTDSLINIQAGTISYRIRQVIDTAFLSTTGAGYIDTVSVALANTCTTTPVNNVPVTGEEITILPNPAVTNLSVRVTTPYAIPQLYFQIIDSKGSLLFQQKKSKPSGTAVFDFAVSRFAKGQYYLAIYNDKKRLAIKEFTKL